jgi:protein O-GlcNAc transferase
MINNTVAAILAEADLYFEQRDFCRALAAYERAFFISPGNIEAKTGVALGLVNVGRYGDAVPHLEQLLELMPDSEQLKIILAESLHKSGRFEDAEACLKQLLALVPGNVEAQVNLGRMYLEREKYDDANRHLGIALGIDPLHADALSYMGLILIKFCQFDDALTALQRACSIAPENVLVLNNLGRACKMMGRHGEALQWYQKALAVEPENAVVVGNYLFALNYCSDLEREYIAAEHFRLAPMCAAKVVREPFEFCSSHSGSKLRIGYVSGDFYTHSVAYFIEPVLQHHDYARFDVFCYSLGSTNDETTERLKSLPCSWREMQGASPETLSERVRQDRIDLLVDLSGHTADNRLGAFAIRSAPVQVSWIGYPNTSGLPQMDYYITDAVCDPPGLTDHLFTERLWRLPRVFCCYLPPMEFPAISPAPFTSNGYITFGSFNNFAKVTRQQIQLWAKILRSVPESRLYLKSMALGDGSVRQGVLDMFAAEGVAAERIHTRVVTRTALEHLQEYARVDIAFDTFPYNGTTTTCEALWMGTPVISMAGSTHVSRVGATLLENTGCAEFIASSPEEYVAKAVALAADPQRLVMMRNSLRGMMADSPLMDAAGVTGELEEAFAVMYEAAGWKRRDF